MNPQSRVPSGCRNPQFLTLVIGDLDDDELADAAAVLRAGSRVVEQPDFQSAQAWLNSASEAPVLVVVAQLLPGQFSPEQLDAFRRQIPLARVLRVLGTWCEGEARNGPPWPGTIRLYWYEAPLRLQHEIELLTAGLRSAWSLPLTATDEDRLLTVTPRLLEVAGPVAVCAERFQTAEAVIEVLEDLGAESYWVSPGRIGGLPQPRTCIWDATHCNNREIEQLSLLRQAWPQVPILALLDFPRCEDTQRTKACGADVVLSKPYLIEDLFAALQALHTAAVQRSRETA